MRCFVMALACVFPILAADSVDLAVVNKIKTEAFEHSKVMEHLEYMTDMYGPRLTGSPEFKQAADWALKRLQEYGLENGHLEKWGPFGRSWTLEKFALEMIQPRYSLLAASPLAWSASNNGPVSGEPIFAPLASTQAVGRGERNLEQYIQKYKGKLHGKVVLISEPMHNIADAESKPELHRYTDAELHDLETAPPPVEKIKIDPANLDPPEELEARLRFFASIPPSVQDELRKRRDELAMKRAQFL